MNSKILLRIFCGFLKIFACVEWELGIQTMLIIRGNQFVKIAYSTGTHLVSSHESLETIPYSLVYLKQGTNAAFLPLNASNCKLTLITSYTAELNFNFLSNCRAWSKILNFSDSQAPQPEKGALLWKWLMEHIKHKKEQKEKEEQEKLDDVRLPSSLYH